MVIPTIHMNGTSRKDLLDQVCNAGSAGRAFIDALAKMSPNGRDYYPQGLEAFSLADDEHTARIAKVREIMDELTDLCEAIEYT